jgi:hypothetical protein
MTSKAPGTLNVTSTNFTPALAADFAVTIASSAVLERRTATNRLSCSSRIISALAIDSVS